MPEDRFARTIHEWLVAAAPPDAPDRILDAVAARVDELEQRSMRRWGSVTTAVAASVLVLVAGAALFAGISRIGSPAPSTSPPATPISIRCETSRCGFALVEGAEYASSTFAPRLSMRAPSDRWRVDDDQPGFFRLVVGNDERRNITLMLDPRPTDALGGPVVADVDGAEAFARWLEDRAELTATAPEEVAVAGLTGWSVDIRGDAEFATRSDGCVTEGLCAGVFAYTTGSGSELIYGAASVDAIRLYLLDAAEHIVVIAVEARHSAPVSFLDGEAQEMLESLEIRSLP